MFRVIAVVIAAALVAPLAASARPKPPSKAVIQRLMTEQYVGDDPVNYPTTKYDLKVTAIKRGAPRKGSYRHDGVPPGRKTIVFPTKVTMVYVVCYQDGSVRRDTIVDKQVFFKDEFGEWTHRLQEQQRTPPAQSHVAGPCPIA